MDNKMWHVYKTRKHAYVYDANINQSNVISDELFDELSKTGVLNDSEEVRNLLEQGFFDEIKIEKLEQPLTEYLEVLQDRHLNHLILQVTQNCNLRCAYCPYSQENNLNRKHANINMPWEMAKKSIDFLHAHSVDSERAELSFYGGEPLCNFDLIKKSVEYFEQVFIGKNKLYSMTINGTLLDDEILRFLDNYDFRIMISLDGSKETNDKNRKYADLQRSVFDTVIRQLEHIKDNYPKLFENLMLNIVMDPSENFDDYLKLFKDYEFLNKVSIKTTDIDDSRADHKNIINDDFLAKRTYFAFLNLSRILHVMDYGDALHLFDEDLKNEMINYSPLIKGKPFAERELPSGPCIPGVNKLFVSVKGDFYACEKFSENVDDAIIGNIEKGFDLEKSEKIFNCAAYIDTNCLKCFAFRDCSACFVNAQQGFKDIENKKRRCYQIRSNWHSNLINKAFLDELINGEYGVRLGEIKR